MRRIVVTGMGAVSPLGASVESSWSRLLAGQSGLRRLPHDMVGDLPSKVGGVVPTIQEDPEAGFGAVAIASRWAECLLGALNCDLGRLDNDLHDSTKACLQKITGRSSVIGAISDKLGN